MVNAVAPAPGSIQIVQQIIGPNGEIQQIPIQLTNQQLQLIRAQMTGGIGCSPSCVGSRNQGCQMVYFKAKNPNLCIFGGSCNGRGWYVLWTFGLFTPIWYICGNLVYFFLFW
jgi:hypothetical protein